MMVFLDSALVFLAVPKTGTHAYQEVLLDRADMVIRHPPALKHMPVTRFNKIIRPLFGEDHQRLETLAVIREPLDWLGSWYRYRARADIAGKPQSTADVSFEDFARAYLTDKRPAFADVGSQGAMVTGPDSVCAVDHLFRHDAQEPLRIFLRDRLAMKLKTLPRRNISPQGDLTLPNGVRKRLEKKFPLDFQLYEQARG